MSNVRYLSKSKIKISPGNKYNVSLNRKDYIYYKEVVEYADRVARSIKVDQSISFNVSVDYDGKVKRHKSKNIWSFFGNVKFKNQLDFHGYF